MQGVPSVTEDDNLNFFGCDQCDQPHVLILVLLSLKCTFYQVPVKNIYTPRKFRSARSFYIQVLFSAIFQWR